MRVDFRLVDVFTPKPFAGNQLCVVADPPPELSTEQMQMLAREIGFSETTYVTEVREDGYDVRIFTPVDELPFAGHPTLGTAFVMATLGRIPTSAIQRCTAGEIPVEIDLEAGAATMQQLPTEARRPVEDRAAVARAAGLEPEDLADLPVIAVSTGVWHTIVPLVDEAALKRASRNDAAVAKVCEQIDAESLYLFAIRGDGDVVARMFDRSIEIGEDPATGSAAGPLAAYLSQHRLAGMPGSCRIEQGERVGRPSVIRTEVRDVDGNWRALVGGDVRIVGDGGFEL
ncbi:MAG TPA: PhzF family phenazine biosynthesis protein [Actinomycetota bacterium]|nr:PhzF family phenazine biosynthesis protein [Actinomycetota bacterium]